MDGSLHSVAFIPHPCSFFWGVSHIWVQCDSQRPWKELLCAERLIFKGRLFELRSRLAQSQLRDLPCLCAQTKGEPSAAYLMNDNKFACCDTEGLV